MSHGHSKKPSRSILLRLVLAAALIMLLLSLCQSVNSEQDFAMQRKEMVKYQIEMRGVKDPAVLNAMRAVERHLFVPQNVRAKSYEDYPLPIGEGQTISQPYIVAIMTELLHPDGSGKVLEIGTGSGYQAAVLAGLYDNVYSIEIVTSLCESAKKTLKTLNCSNVEVRCGDGFAGWPEHAPFDGIIVTCAPKEVPQPLIDQLKDGGRLVIPVGAFWQELKVLKKKDGKITTENVIPVRFVPMTGRAQKE